MEKEKSNTRVQFLIASCVALGSAVMGCLASWPAPVMLKFHNNETNIEISDGEMAWMVSMSSPGFIVGSLASQFVSDRFGRRVTVIGSGFPSAVGTIIVAFALKPWLLYLSRFLWGCGNGMMTTVVGIYLAEIADKEIRGTLSLITRFMFNFGNLLMMTIGPFVSYETLNYMLLVTPVVYLLSCWWIPETPYYYLKEGRTDAARKVLVRLQRHKDEKLLEDELLQMQADVRKDMRRSSTTKELFTGKQYRKAIVICVGLKLTQIMTGQLIIQQYLGVIMDESKTNMKLSTAFVIFGAVRFIVGVMSSIIADRVGRRPLLIYSYLGTGISLATVGIYFFLLEVIQIDHEVLSRFALITFIGLIFSNIISTLGFNSIIAVVPAEIFPLNVKFVAMTWLSIYGGLINFGVTRSYQVVKDLTGLCGVFWIFAAVAVGGSVFCYLIVPETKGKSLREIQVQLQGEFYDDQEVKKINQVDPIEVGESKELKEIISEGNKLL